MAIFLDAVWLVLWIIMIPFFSGIIPTMAICKNKKRLTTVYLCGWLQMIALFQIICTVMVLLSKPLSLLITIFTILMYILSICGITITVISSIKTSVSEYFDLPDFKKISFKALKEDKKVLMDILTWCVFGVIFLFQILMSIFYATPNGDDSYYVTISEIANQLDGMYLLSPYTGFTEGFDFRHALSQFPMFYAFEARQLGLHSAIVAHTIMPPILLFITYLIFYHIGCKLFEEEKEKIPVFMVIISALQMFGAYSIYSSEVFFLTRTWQGKSLLANIAIPCVLCILIAISKVSMREKNEMQLKGEFFGYFLLLAMANILGGFTSSLGLLLLSLYEAVTLFIIAIRNQRAMVVIMGIAAMIPSAVYMMLYIFL